MLSHETRLKMNKGKAQSEVLHNMSVNFAKKRLNYNKSYSTNKRSFDGENIGAFDNNMSRFITDKEITCQICFIPGHGVYKCRNIFNQNFILRPWRSGLRPRGVINYRGLVILRAVTAGDLVFLMVPALFFLNNLEMDFYFKAMLPIKTLISCLLKAILTFKDH